METLSLFSYQVQGRKDTVEFAKSMLLLTNLKSNSMGIVDFRTYQDSNDIRIISNHRNDDYIESQIGEIISVEDIVGVELDISDLNDSGQDNIDKLIDHEVDYEVVLNSSF